MVVRWSPSPTLRKGNVGLSSGVCLKLGPWDTKPQDVPLDHGPRVRHTTIVASLMLVYIKVRDQNKLQNQTILHIF